MELSNMNTETTTIIGGYEYPIAPKDWDFISRAYNGRYVFFSPDGENLKYVRVYNPFTEEHFYIERVWPEVGESGLLFFDTSRLHKNQCFVKTWSDRKECSPNEFVRYEIQGINENNYCIAFDGSNKPSGVYRRDCFYKVVNIHKAV
jgi:hypothetical protein